MLLWGKASMNGNRDEALAVIPGRSPEEDQVVTVPVRRGAEFEGGLLTPDIVKEIENQVILVRRMRVAVCKLTEAEHWRDFGGKPYLMDGGIHAIASTIGLEFGEPRVTREAGTDEDGDFVRFTCHLAGHWRGRKIHEMGASSTRDPFFAEAKGQKIPLKSISLGNVEKKSITNAQHRILAKLTGLGGVTWGVLEQAGIRRGGGGTTQFRGQERKMATGAGDWTPDKERLWGLLLELNNGDAQQAGDALFRLTDNPGKGFKGKRDPRELSDAALKWLLPHVESAWKKAGVDVPPPAEPAPEREAGGEG